MRAKNQISLIHKAVYAIVVLTTFMSAFFGDGNFSFVNAQGLNSNIPNSKNNSNLHEGEQVVAQVTGSHQITYFKDNKAAAISLTFDDGFSSHLTVAIPQLNARDLKGTFFVITSRENAPSWAAWQSAVADGHEVASHTVNHINLTTLNESQVSSELIDSQASISQNVPGQVCASLAYPETFSNAAIQAAASETYDAARSGWVSPGRFLNHYQSGSDQYGSWNAINFYTVASMGGDNLGLNNEYLTDVYFNDSLAAAASRHAWFNLHFHDITDANEFGNILDYIQDKPGYWIDTFCNVSRYMKERLNSTVQVVTENTSEIRLNIVMNASLSTDTYDFPLTIRSTVPASWTDVNFQQGSTFENLTVVTEGSDKVVYYNAIPNGGEVILTPNPIPVIGSLNPSSIDMGSAAFTLTVNGADFVTSSIVRWNGADRTTAYVNRTQLTASISAADIASAGTANVTVFSPAPGGGTSGQLPFSINQPNAPVAFTKTSPANGAANQPTSLTLSWAASAGAASYEYCYDTSNDNACSSWTSNGNSTSKVLSGLTPATTYYWHVRAVNAGGTTYADGSSTVYQSFTTIANPPAAFGKTSPANGAANQPTSLILTWAASAGAVSYEYCYDTSNDNACSSWTSNGNSTSKALSGLTAGLTYYWHVRAINAGGVTYANSNGNAFWSFTLSCYSLTGNTAPVAGGTVNASPAPNCNNGTQYLSGTALTLTAVPQSGYALFAWSGDVSGSSSQVNVVMMANKTVTATFASYNSALAAPTLRSPQTNLVTSNNTPAFTWTSVTGGQVYEIMFASDSAFANMVSSKIVNGTSDTVTPSLGDGKYYWRVRAYNASNQFGKWSLSRVFTIDTLGPSAPILNLPANNATVRGTPIFKWQNANTAVAYEFQYANDAGFTSVVYTSSRQTNYCSPSAMKVGTYYWRVRAKDAAGNWGAWSAPFKIAITK